MMQSPSLPSAIFSIALIICCNKLVPSIIAKPLNTGRLRRNRGFTNGNGTNRIGSGDAIDPFSDSSLNTVSKEDEQSALKILKRQNKFIESDMIENENNIVKMVQALDSESNYDFSMKLTDAPSVALSVVPSFSSSDKPALISSDEPSLIQSIDPTNSQNDTTSASKLPSDKPTDTEPSFSPSFSSSSFSSSSFSDDATLPQQTVEPSSTTSSPSFVPIIVSSLSSSPPTIVLSVEPSLAPTKSVIPSSVPTLEDCLITEKERIDQIYELLDAVGNPESIRDLSTPQGLAADWLIRQDFRKICPVETIIVQRWVIAVFYYSTNGDSWIQCSTAGSDLCGSIYPFEFKRRFLSESSECDWGGITCNTDDRVTEIEFEENNLIGTIPTEIGLLKELEILGMEKGGLTSTIPTEIGSLVNLVFIDLDFNKISGSLPEQLFALTGLRTLDLNDNELTGDIDQLGAFLDLEFLQLQHNEFTGTIPEELENLSSMTAFNLHDNLFTGVMPESVCNLTVAYGGVLKSLLVDCEIGCSCCVSCRQKRTMMNLLMDFINWEGM